MFNEHIPYDETVEASRFFLTKELPEDWWAQDERAIEAFITDHITYTFRHDEASVVLQMILDLACKQLEHHGSQYDMFGGEDDE